VAFCCTETELALKKKFEGVYERTESPIMQAIERQVCGCDFGGNSWTRKGQADAMIRLLGLGPNSDLIDLGAGTGWPGIYMARMSGCSVTLVDLPEIGLQIASNRAEQEGLADRVTSRIADAADLPFPAGSFDAISHSDLLCCLIRKRAVLQQSRRVIRKNGVMAFTVISITPGLNSVAYDRALKNAPEFIEAENNYRALLAETEWAVTKCQDMTGEYRDSCDRQISADCENRAELAKLLGAEEAKLRMASWRSKLQAIQDGLFVRELFVCQPM
jgi:cyclopropane fatty-acyl-phospholipid synthase-like methyltransferase